MNNAAQIATTSKASEDCPIKARQAAGGFSTAGSRIARVEMSLNAGDYWVASVVYDRGARGIVRTMNPEAGHVRIEKVRSNLDECNTRIRLATAIQMSFIGGVLHLNVVDRDRQRWALTLNVDRWGSDTCRHVGRDNT